MQYAHLGRTGLKVSRFCLGTMNFGERTSPEDSFAILDRALEWGINFLDTANIYGARLGEGVTEQIVGRWFAQNPSHRDQVVLATKVYGRMGEGVNDQRLSAYHIRKACDDSLRRLQTDHIDLYQFHHVDRSTPWEEIWQMLETLIQQGKVLYVGSSNFSGWQLAQAQGEARARRLVGLVSEQSLYNLKTRAIELEVIPACQAFGLGLLPWSPLAGGLLGGVLNQPQTARRGSDWIQKNLEENRSKVEAYERFCQTLGEEPGNVALAWLLHNVAVTSPILGPRTLEQLNRAMRALDLTLDQDALKQLDEIWPGPGGEAPEAYAW